MINMLLTALLSVAASAASPASARKPMRFDKSYFGAWVENAPDDGKMVCPA